MRASDIRELKDRWSREVVPTIENNLFHVRDVTFREDACRVRSGSAPLALAAIRTGVLNYIRRTGQKPPFAKSPC